MILTYREFGSRNAELRLLFFQGSVLTRRVLVACIFLAMCGLQIASGAEPTPLFPEGVGSNFVFLKLGDYAKNPSAENWTKDVQVTLLHYHQHVAEVRARLNAMRVAGQTEIALMLWYVEEGREATSFAHVICPKDGAIPEEVARNIRDLLKDIADAGFDNVIMRLAAQGKADPLGESYDSARAPDSWKLFESVHAICEESKLNVFYDLGAETMGHPYSVRPGAQAFLKLMWANYTKKYPARKTVGFTFNHAYEPATKACLQIYQDSGTWPAAISIDLYEDPAKFLGNLASALKSFGKADFPVIINETFRNNCEMAKVLAESRKKDGLNYRMLLQWPLDKGAAGHSNDPISNEIDAYLTARRD